MGKRQRDCVECGAPVGYLDRQHCCLCWRRHQIEDAKSACPDCGQARILVGQTGRCKTCSRRCVDCGALVRRRDRDQCRHCRRRREAEAAKQMCPRCGKPGLLREHIGWCGPCSNPGGSKKPPVECVVCGEARRHAAKGMCGRCWQRHPDRPFVRMDTLIDSLETPPAWLGEFAVHLAARHCPARACRMITELDRLLNDSGSTHPQALLERARRPGRSAGTLAKTLEGFFLTRSMALPLDQAERLAAGRRQRRLDGVPESLRPAVSGFEETCLRARERARRAGTRPRSDNTIERHLAIIRDLARYVSGKGKTDWALVEVGDVEEFLADRPAYRKSQLTALRHFFAWAKAHHVILVNPTRGVIAREPRGFRGTTLELSAQRELFRRWTTDPAVHPHEAMVGLLALLHGAINQELRSLTIHDIDPANHSVRLGSRPHPTPLDPASWAALQRCLAHRDALTADNPHVLVTKQTKSTTAPASTYYLSHVLDAADVRPRMLRSTRLVDLITTLDPKLVAAAFGMRPEGVLHYLADHVDESRLPDQPERRR